MRSRATSAAAPPTKSPRGPAARSAVKLAVLAIVTSALIPACTFARLGDSLEECQARYGPLDTWEQPEVYSVVEGELFVTLKFQDGICRSVTYAHNVRARGLPPMPIEAKQREELLKRNFGGRAYSTRVLADGNVEYETSDGRFHGFYDAAAAQLVVADKKGSSP
jgi:hypothetical protein